MYELCKCARQWPRTIYFAAVASVFVCVLVRAQKGRRRRQRRWRQQERPKWKSLGVLLSSFILFCIFCKNRFIPSRVRKARASLSCFRGLHGMLNERQNGDYELFGGPNSGHKKWCGKRSVLGSNNNTHAHSGHKMERRISTISSSWWKLCIRARDWAEPGSTQLSCWRRNFSDAQANKYLAQVDTDYLCATDERRNTHHTQSTHTHSSIRFTSISDPTAQLTKRKRKGKTQNMIKQHEENEKKTQSGRKKGQA